MVLAEPIRMSMGTACILMPIDAKILTLTQWLSPAYPIGAFAYSHGIEAAIAHGWIEDTEGLEHWVRDCLTRGSGRADAVWLRLAFASEDPCQIDALARAFAPSQERLREAALQGRAFVQTTNSVWGFELPNLLLPVAVGHAARIAHLEEEATVSLFLQAFVTNLVSAAMRLMPIGQTAGQRVIHQLQNDCLKAVFETRSATPDDVFSNAFLSDIAAMKHETQQPRLFQS